MTQLLSKYHILLKLVFQSVCKTDEILFFFRSNPNEKSNQVSIAGEMAGVERARARVRELTPLIFQFDIAIVPSFHSAPDPNNTYLRYIDKKFSRILVDASVHQSGQIKTRKFTC